MKWILLMKCLEGGFHWLIWSRPAFSFPQKVEMHQTKFSLTQTLILDGFWRVFDLEPVLYPPKILHSGDHSVIKKSQTLRSFEKVKVFMFKILKTSINAMVWVCFMTLWRAVLFHTSISYQSHLSFSFILSLERHKSC